MRTGTATISAAAGSSAGAISGKNKVVLSDILVHRTGASTDQVKQVFPTYDGTTLGITTA